GVSMAQATPTAGGRPAIVLVHGAFADASSWAGGIKELRGDGLSLMGPANPLRSVAGGTGFTPSGGNQIQRPVLLGRHSDGGAVITNAGAQTPNAVGLVYVGAFIPDEGEVLQNLSAQATDSLLGPALRPAQYPKGAGAKPGTEFYVDPASFHAVFCADLPAE